MISHDRYFLDITVETIVEIWNKQMHFYAGNYDQYLAGKAARKEQLESAYKTQRDRIEQLEVFINRFRYTATKAKQVQSRIKELEKMERIQIPDEEKTVHFSFPAAEAERAHRRRVRERRQELWRAGLDEHKVFAERKFHDRARRAHRAGRSQRGREVHPD